MVDGDNVPGSNLGAALHAVLERPQDTCGPTVCQMLWEPAGAGKQEGRPDGPSLHLDDASAQELFALVEGHDLARCYGSLWLMEADLSFGAARIEGGRLFRGVVSDPRLYLNGLIRRTGWVVNPRGSHRVLEERVVWPNDDPAPSGVYAGDEEGLRR